MWNHIKTIFLVTLVTLIIWVFAESESLRSAEVRGVEIAVLPVVGSKLTVEITDSSPAIHGNSLRADLVIDGPTAAVDAAERVLRRPITISPGMPGFSIDPGPHAVDIQAVLRGHPDLRLAGRGVSIKSVTPETLNVALDELVSRTVKIDVDVPGAELDGPADVRPGAATIVLPASAASKITENTALIARVDAAVLEHLSPGRRETVPGVRLLPPSELASVPHLKIEPEAVDVALTLRTKTTSIKVASVPVHVRIAPGELSKWDIEIPEQDRFLADVTVSGPSDLVKQIQDKTVPLVATVSLSFEELERGIPSKDAVFCDLPTGLRFDVANKTVRLKIKRREIAPPAAGGKGP
jgi:hypothetical protein